MTIRSICGNCTFDDIYLDYLASQNLDAANQCTVCGKSPAARLSHIVEKVAETVRQQIRREDEDSLYIATRYGDGPNGEELQSVLQELGCDHPWSIHLADELSDHDFCWSSKVEGFFDSDASYFSERVSLNKVEEEWSRFVEIAQSGPRYFNPKAKQFLDDLFHVVQLSDSNKAPWDITLTKNKLIYRGRTFDDIRDMQKAMEAPDKLMGAPPSAFAKGLRMNAPGSPMFYGAEKSETILRELRPPIDSWVLICGFRPLKELRLLDLSELAKAEGNSSRPTSYFNPEAIVRLQHLHFLSYLPNRLTKPIPPSREETDYRPTQMIANYIENVLRYDGITWRSAQHENAFNIGLFSRSSKAGLNISISESLSAHNQFEWYGENEGDLNNFELKRTIATKNDKLSELGFFLPQHQLNTSLEVDLTQMKVHRISDIIYKSDKYGVNFKNKKPDSKFNSDF